LEIGDWGLGISFEGSVFSVQWSGFKISVLEFRGWGFRFQVQGSGFRVQGSGPRV